MKKIDGRKLNTETQQQLRYAAIRLHEKGLTYAAIAGILNISVAFVYYTCKKYRSGGIKAIEIRKRGVELGTNGKLSNEQTQILEKLLIEKTPDQIGLNFSLWTRQAIRNLIFKLWSIHMPLRTITDYMKRLGFTPQKPIKRAYEQDS